MAPNFFFSRKLHAPRADVAANDLADERMLELITERARQRGAPMNLNHQRRALTWWWKTVYRAIRLIEWSGLSKSDLVLSLAIDEGSTPLHVAARKGSRSIALNTAPTHLNEGHAHASRL